MRATCEVHCAFRSSIQNRAAQRLIVTAPSWPRGEAAAATNLLRPHFSTRRSAKSGEPRARANGSRPDTRSADPSRTEFHQIDRSADDARWGLRGQSSKTKARRSSVWLAKTNGGLRKPPQPNLPRCAGMSSRPARRTLTCGSARSTESGRDLTANQTRALRCAWRKPIGVRRKYVARTIPQLAADSCAAGTLAHTVTRTRCFSLPI